MLPYPLVPHLGRNFYSALVLLHLVPTSWYANVFSCCFYRDSGGNSSLVSGAEKDLVNLFEVDLTLHYVHIYFLPYIELFIYVYKYFATGTKVCILGGLSSVGVCVYVASGWFPGKVCTAVQHCVLNRMRFCMRPLIQEIQEIQVLKLCAYFSTHVLEELFVYTILLLLAI